MLDLGEQRADIHDRIDALERLQRLHAQSITHADEAITANRGAINLMDQDISKYKLFIAETHGTIDGYVKQENKTHREAIQTLNVQFESFMGVIPVNVELLLQKVKFQSEQLDQLTQMMKPGTVVPEPRGKDHGQFNIHTPKEVPAPAAAQPPPAAPTEEYVANDPWWQGPAARRNAQNATAQPAPVGMPEQPIGSDPWAARHGWPQQPRQAEDNANSRVPRPGGYGTDAMPQAPMTPPNRPASSTPLAEGGDLPQSPFQNGAGPHRPGVYQPGVSAYAGGRLCFFEPSRKENKNLFTFTQDAKDFQLWRNRMVDHFCRSTQKWRQTFEYIQTGTTMISKAWLRNNNIEGINAWDLATMVESFLVDDFPRSMYNRRVQLAGGEMGNGFEMWRRLYIDYQGGSTAVEFGGVRLLQEFPKCQSIGKLGEHLDDWLDVLTTYGTEWEHCPRLLRNMALSIIPKSLEDEILDEGDDPKLRSYADIIRWCKRKVATLRTKELSELSRKPPGMPRVNSLRSADDEPDTHPTRNAPKDMSWEGMKKRYRDSAP